MTFIAFILWTVILTALYLLPTYIAYRRNHENRVPILLINLLFGWSLIGWVASLAWALTSKR